MREPITKIDEAFERHGLALSDEGALRIDGGLTADAGAFLRIRVSSNDDGRSDRGEPLGVEGAFRRRD